MGRFDHPVLRTPNQSLEIIYLLTYLLLYLLTSFSQAFKLISTTRGQPSLKNSQRAWILREIGPTFRKLCVGRAFSRPWVVTYHTQEVLWWATLKWDRVPRSANFPSDSWWSKIISQTDKAPKLWRPAAVRHPWCQHQRFIFHPYLRHIQ